MPCCPRAATSPFCSGSCSALPLWSVEKQLPTRVESSGGIALSKDFPPLPAKRALTYDEAIWARVAGNTT